MLEIAFLITFNKLCFRFRHPNSSFFFSNDTTSGSHYIAIRPKSWGVKRIQMNPFLPKHMKVSAKNDQKIEYCLKQLMTAPFLTLKTQKMPFLLRLKF